MKTITLDAKVIEAIAAHYDEALRLIEDRFNVRLAARGNDVTVTAETNEGRERVDHVADLLEQLALLHAKGIELGREDLKTAVALIERQPKARLVDHFLGARIRTSAKKTIVAKSPNQRLYVEAIRDNDLVFGIGPAGTGKTYLAVAMAVAFLNEKRVKRIILARPAVEAGENLGFLPGDLAAKVDPYLRPLYDALYDMLDPQRAERLMEQGTIEVAPLAFMRGRTLDHSFMILDEAQNTTSEQMKMFLTRIGFDSKAVVTGDVTQIDLPVRKRSGLIEARQVVQGIHGTAFVHFDESDVVRHPLVQRIVLAYERHGQASENGLGLDADAPTRPQSPVDETRSTPGADVAPARTEDDP
jgi:phosphate starvation-inducible PhoH-like protein